MNQIDLKKVSNLKLSMLMYRSKTDLLQLLSELTKLYGFNFKYGFGAFKGYLLNDPDVVRYIQLENWQNFPKSRRYKTFSPLIGESILVSNGDQWKKSRQIAQPIFQQRDLLTRFDEIVKESTTDLLNNLKKENVDLFSVLSKHTFNVITRITFGSQVDEIFDEFHHSILKLQESCIKRALSPVSFFDHLPFPSNLTFKSESKKVHKLLNTYIEKRVSNPNDKTIDLLDRYINTKNTNNYEFSLIDIRNELVTLIIAGNETSALTLFWAMLEILNNNEIKDKVVSEVRSNSPTSFKENDFVSACPFLNKVILETLRKYPAVWAVSREVKENVTFKNINFKKNDIILISPYFFHRNPKIWENSELFNPHRFDKEVDEDHYIPFTRGPRFCIGKALALFEIRYTLYNIFKSISSIQIKSGNHCAPLGLINLYPNQKVVLNNNETH